MQREWLTAKEAMAALGIKPQSLYANVSRGRIRTRQSPTDRRQRHYSASDVAALKAKGVGARAARIVAAETMAWGEPVITTSISGFENADFLIRGQNLLELAEGSTLEDMARLLWLSEQTIHFRPKAPYAPQPAHGGFLSRALALLAGDAASALPMLGRGPDRLVQDATRLVGGLTWATAEGSLEAELDCDVHEALASRWSVPGAADGLRKCLVLLAEHELNASSFAVRVCASTGASLGASLLAGLATLTGPRHGGSGTEIEFVLKRAQLESPDDIVSELLRAGRTPPGFGHRLYPHGDPRARAILSDLHLPPYIHALIRSVWDQVGVHPNVDFALCAMKHVYGLPEDAPLALFALGRSVGWIAHAFEQIQHGGLIRPRARMLDVLEPGGIGT